MGKPTGFMEIPRRDRSYRAVDDRIQHFEEFVIPLSDQEVLYQGSRCMDCGIPYCHSGCPVNNIIPDWNDLVYRSRWREAAEVLHSTNNFPEFTGRICPAPCEAACTLNLHDQPVTIKTIECAIVDKAWQAGWIQPQIPTQRTGKRVAVVGGGPAGLACAQQLARAGHQVALYEKNDRFGGLLRYGIPDFKMEKGIIDRRLSQMLAEGVEFHPNSHIGVDLSPQELRASCDALVLTGGSEHPRDLPIPGRDLAGVHFAMDFLPQQNHRIAGDVVPEAEALSAHDKDVVVIGGGDTGSDCIGTSIRQGARSVTQIEIMPQPPERENQALTWPNWPLKMRTSSSQEEGVARDWSIASQQLLGQDGAVTALEVVRVDAKFKPLPNSKLQIKADLVLLAMGFVHPIHAGLLQDLGVELDKRGNVAANTENYSTSLEGVFSAGDMRRGQSLVVWAIREGRQVARAVDEYLMGESGLPR